MGCTLYSKYSTCSYEYMRIYVFMFDCMYYNLEQMDTLYACMQASKHVCMCLYVCVCMYVLRKYDA